MNYKQIKELASFYTLPAVTKGFYKDKETGVRKEFEQEPLDENLFELKTAGHVNLLEVLEAKRWECFIFKVFNFENGEYNLIDYMGMDIFGNVMNAQGERAEIADLLGMFKNTQCQYVNSRKKCITKRKELEEQLRRLELQGTILNKTEYEEVELQENPLLHYKKEYDYNTFMMVYEVESEGYLNGYLGGYCIERIDLGQRIVYKLKRELERGCLWSKVKFEMDDLNKGRTYYVANWKYSKEQYIKYHDLFYSAKYNLIYEQAMKLPDGEYFIKQIRKLLERRGVVLVYGIKELFDVEPDMTKTSIFEFLGLNSYLWTKAMECFKEDEPYLYVIVKRVCKQMYPFIDIKSLDHTFMDEMFARCKEIAKVSSTLSNTENLKNAGYLESIARSAMKYKGIQGVRDAYDYYYNLLDFIYKTYGKSALIEQVCGSFYGTHRLFYVASDWYLDYLLAISDLPEAKCHGCKVYIKAEEGKPMDTVLKELHNIYTAKHRAYMMEQKDLKLKENLEKYGKQAEEEYYFEDENYVTVFPKSLSDYSDEGVQMHNCVASYANQVAEGKTNIIFIRKKENPKKSYCTVEMKGNAIQQAYLHHNTLITEEDKDLNKFLKRWVEKYSISFLLSKVCYAKRRDACKI